MMSSNSSSNGAGTGRGSSRGGGAGGGGGGGDAPTRMSVITAAAWDVRVTKCEVAKGDLNQLVMNYLIVEGYRDAAAHFLEESGTQPKVDLRTIEDRVAIRKAMMDGDVVQAMNLANEMDPMMLDGDRELRFGLLKQRLLELVRRGETEEALNFAAERLAPEGAGDPMLLRQVEEAITLLAFEIYVNIHPQDCDIEDVEVVRLVNGCAQDVGSCPLSGLLDLEQRQAAAGRLNAAVLKSQQQEKGPWLPDFLRQLVYTQNALAEKVDFPRIEGIGGISQEMEVEGGLEGPR